MPKHSLGNDCYVANCTGAGDGYVRRRHEGLDKVRRARVVVVIVLVLVAIALVSGREAADVGPAANSVGTHAPERVSWVHAPL
ncbi:MAG: hypothetical protein WDA27_10360 [Actinomycetota bacterium]